MNGYSTRAHPGLFDFLAVKGLLVASDTKIFTKMIVLQVAVMTFSLEDSSMSLSWPSVIYITEALPSLHAYTECDVTAAFMNKGHLN